MNLQTLIGLALALPLVGGNVADAHAKSKVKRVLITEFPADANFDASVIKVINDFVAGAVRDQGFDVLSPQDLTAVLGYERQKQLLGCSESSCLAELGGAMGVEYILRGTIAVLDRETALSLNLIDTSGRVVSEQRTRVRGKSSSDLVTALESEVPKLMAPVRSPDLNPTLASTASPSGTSAISSSSTATAEEGHTGSYVLLGVGAAGLIASGVTALLANSSLSTARTQNAKGQSYTSSLQQANTMGSVALGAAGVGVVCAGLGAALLFTTHF